MYTSDSYAGCVKGNCKNGYGEFVSQSGVRYKGNYSNGYRSGNGSLIWPNGSKYRGNFRTGKFHGRGIFYWEDGTKYDGNWEFGLQNGKGIKTLPSGSVIKGEFRKGKLYKTDKQVRKERAIKEKRKEQARIKNIQKKKEESEDNLFGSSDKVIRKVESRDVIDDAYRFCAAIESTGMASGCEISGAKGTIDVTMDTNSSEARKMCKGMVSQMASMTKNFRNGRWKLQIFSPYGSRPIARCSFK